MALGEYPLIEELTGYIKPFEELWNLNVEFTTNMKAWKDNYLSKLSPD